MLEQANDYFETSEEYRSLRAICFDDGVWSDWLPPEDHPLFARFRAASSKTRHLELTSVEAYWTGDDPIAKWAALPANAGGALRIGWVRGTPVNLPEADEVLVVDRNGRTVMSFEALMEELGDEVEEVPGPFPMVRPRANSSGKWDYPSRLYPMLRTPEYGAASELSLRGMMPADVALRVPPRLSYDFDDGLTIEVVIDMGDRMSPIMRHQVRAGDDRDLLDVALANLEAASVAPFERIRSGVYRAAWNDGYSASRLLLPALFEGLIELEGEVLVFAPTVDMMLIVGAEDRDAIAFALSACEQLAVRAASPYAWRETLYGFPWIRTPAGFRRWSVPADHPLAARIAALDASLARLRNGSAAQAETFHRAVFQPSNPS
jgi:hypothetical protein